ncbi:MAG TPA: NADH-ubiquinone oxidoreductase-F iron-sulfur binding region domain-containing protein [Bacteroidales bacterium]|nr:NADH-ubiquinone oxidoreductase-F iron-sulfur binding region domain-containing protein [Bacteroidales bacterium]HPS62794.1 NADH-ubiquinone oxidoreductase-F iron-sulfur binding region domain-containing protein [Bacteroidales bacterium]
MASPILTEPREFLVEKVIKNYSNIFDKETLEGLSILRRYRVEKPVIFIGTGSCGVMAGAEETLEAVGTYLAKNATEAEVVRVGCIGFCSAEPILDVQLPGKARLSFQHVTADKVEDLLNAVFHRTLLPDLVLGQYRQESQESWPNVPLIEQLPFFSRQHRIILKNTGLTSPWNIDEYIAAGGYKSLYKTVLNYTPDKVCEIIDQSELRGRGGGGYLTGKKWMVTLGTGSDQKYLICNADESDPGAFMNRVILEGDPHRVLEGIAIAAYAVGANKAYIYLRSDYTLPIRIFDHALKQAKEYGFLGENIFGSGFGLNIRISQGAGAYVCGEETALIASIEGRRGMPQAKPPYPAEKGLFGHPTIVNNIETLANVPTIIENGPSWFKSVGTQESRGTKLFSIAGKSQRTGFIEIPLGMAINDIVNGIAGGVKDGKALKAVQLGGPSGVCIPADNLSVPVAYESAREMEASIGLGGIIVFDEETCMVDQARYFMEFLQHESCGKCIPCREGTRRMLQILDEITRRPREESSHETLSRFKGVVEMESLAGVIHDTSLCGLGRNAPNPVLSTLKWFRDEFEEHIFDRECRAGACHDLRTYIIKADVCNGCNICQKKCPEQAIIGTIKSPHFIIEAKCTGCGICFDSCKFNAIYFK